MIYQNCFIYITAGATVIYVSGITTSGSRSVGSTDAVTLEVLATGDDLGVILDLPASNAGTIKEGPVDAVNNYLCEYV